MKKIILCVATLLAAWLPSGAFAEATPAKNVLLWMPSYGLPVSQSIVDYTVADIRRAYEDLIPNSPQWAAKYPGGIRVDAVYSKTATGIDLPANLDDYALVYVILPYPEVTDDQVARLKTVVARGGRVVLVGEHGNWAPHENVVLTHLARNMGAHFEIAAGSLGNYTYLDEFNYNADLLKEPLDTMPKSACVAPIKYSGFAQKLAWLVKDTNFVWAVDEVSGNGRMTVFSDVNWFMENSSTLNTNTVPFFERLLSNAIACEQKVIDGDDPNQDIEENIPAGMVAAVKDANNFLTYYSTVAAACAAASQANNCTVMLKRDVTEDFVLPVGVTFDTSEVTTNYAGTVSAPPGYSVRINDAHTIYKVEAIATPAAPEVTATDGTRPDCVVVTWTKPSSERDIIAYEVKRVKVGSTLEVVLTNSVTGLTFTDFTMKPGVKYIYYVRAKSDAGWGWYGEDIGWTGQGGGQTISVPVAVDVEASDGTKICDLEITTAAFGGGENWYGQDDETHDGIDAARSGYLPDGGTNMISTVVTNAGTISFWWKVSSEPYDKLSFSVNGVVQTWISGAAHDWEQRSIDVGAGTNTLVWMYAKDEQGYLGQDAGWVDQIVWKPLALPGAPAVTAKDGASTNGVEVSWTPSTAGGPVDSYEILRVDKDGNETVLTNGFVGTAWTDTTATPGEDYTYYVRASNAAGRGAYGSDDGWIQISLVVMPDVIELDSSGVETNIAILSSMPWTVTVGTNWLTSQQVSDSSAAVNVEANTSLDPRMSTVTVTAGAGTHAVSATVTVLQAGRPPIMDVGFAMPDEYWRTRMQISTNTVPETYAPVSVFTTDEKLCISFGWTNKSEVAVSMPSIRFRFFKPGGNGRICVADGTSVGRPGETLRPGEVGYSGNWTNNVLKILKPGDYLLEAEIAPADTFGDADRSDNTAVFRFAVRDPSLEASDAFPYEEGWTNLAFAAGNDFAQPPHLATRIGSAWTNETAVQFGPYVPMNGINGHKGSVKKPLDLVFLIDYSGSMSGCIAGLVNNIGNFIDQLLLGDPGKGIDPLEDLRIKIVGVNDTQNYSSRDWFLEGVFTTDRTVLKRDLTNLRNLCGYGSGNGGESSYSALYYICKGWKPTDPRSYNSPHVPTDAARQFRGTNEAARVVLLFTDEPPILPFTRTYYSTLQPEDYGTNGTDVVSCLNMLDAALTEAEINLTIVGDGDYCRSYSYYDQDDKKTHSYSENIYRYANIINRDLKMRELKEVGNLATFTGNADLLRGLATNVSAKVAVEAKVVDPMFSASIRGGGTLIFDWKNDSVAGTNNTFEFVCEGVTNLTKAAGQDWETVTLGLGEGLHLFKWSYEKLGGYTNNVVTDCGVLSNVRWEAWTNTLSVFHVSEIPVVETQDCVKVDWYGTPEDLAEDADTNVVFTVACNTIWKVVEKSDWITVVQGNGTGDGELVVTVATNNTYAERLGHIVVRAGEYGLPSDKKLVVLERTVFIRQQANPYNEDGFVEVLTVDIKPRWPWSRKVDIDFRVKTPEKEGTPVRVKVWGLNKEGGSMITNYPTAARLRECAAKKNVEVGFGSTNVASGTITGIDAKTDPKIGGLDSADGMAYIVCPTSGLYRFTWDMAEDWAAASVSACAKTGLDDNYSPWNDGSNGTFHSPEFSVRLEATPEDPTRSHNPSDVLEADRTVRVDMRLVNAGTSPDKPSTGRAGGSVLVGVERIGHPYGWVDPVLVDTTNRSLFPSNGWNSLDFVRDLPAGYTRRYDIACVINDGNVAIEGGMITNDVHWTADKVHVVRDNVFVAAGAHLTVDAEAIVKVCVDTRIYVLEEPGSTSLHNILFEGAYLPRSYDSRYGGDTLYFGEGTISGTSTEGANSGQAIVWSPARTGKTFETEEVKGTVTKKCPHQAVYRVEMRVKYLNTNGEVGDRTNWGFKYYSRGQRYGEIAMRPSEPGCAFYGWYAVAPTQTSPAVLGANLCAVSNDVEKSIGYVASQKYFVKSEECPFPLNGTDDSDKIIYALVCPIGWAEIPDSVLKSAASGRMVLAKESVAYDGNDHANDIQVKELWVGPVNLSNSIVSVNRPASCVAVGKYPVTVNFAADYSGSPTAWFEITARSVERASIVFTPASKMYERTLTEPAVTVLLPDGTAVANDGYTVRWLDTNSWPYPGKPPRIGKYKVEVSFKGNYVGPSITNEFEITVNPNYVYTEYKTEELARNQVAQHPKTNDGTAARRILYIGGRTNDAMTEYVIDLLKNDIDLCDYINANFVCWADDIDVPGSKAALYAGGLDTDDPPILAVVSANDTMRALASHVGYITRDELWAFLTNAKTLPEDVSSATLELSDTSFTYNGSEQKPTTVTMNYAGTNIVVHEDALVWSGGCTNVGTYTVKAVFKGNPYVGETEPAAFEIVPALLQKSDVELLPTGVTYDGKTHRPDVNVTNEIPFTVDYGTGGYTSAGSYTVLVTAIGNYTGTITNTFEIARKPVVAAIIDLDSVRVEINTNKPPTSSLRPSVIAVWNASRTYVEGVDYTLDWGPGDYMTLGTNTITATFIGNYSGTATATFVIDAAAEAMVVPVIDPTAADGVEVKAASEAEAVAMVKINVPAAAASSGVSSDTYQTYFTKKATYDDKKRAYMVEVELNREVVLPGEDSGELGHSVLDAAMDSSVTETEIRAVPGLYYRLVGSSSLSGSYGGPEAVLATGSTVKLEKPVLSGPSAFFKVTVSPTK